MHVVALTFDDGPNDTATPLILDVLATKGVPATFFVFGERAGEHPDLIARMVDAGHGVQPHCWSSHASHHELTSAELDKDIARTLRALEELGCRTPRFWRPPNGDIKDPESYDIAARHELQLVTWTLQTCDWANHTPDRILREIDDERRDDAVLRAHSVVLMHDVAEGPRLLAGLLDRMSAPGYEAELLAEGNAAIAQSGDYTFGRQDGKLPCGLEYELSPGTRSPPGGRSPARPPA
jgi:peptidoglycan/xylan/chitin deacetylase (PgdA/CDA1 family)